MRMRYQPKIILSVQKFNVDQGENSRNHLALQGALKEMGLQYRLTYGRHQGQEESSVVLDYREHTLEVAMQIAREFDQDSILLIDEDGKGVLRYLTGRKDVKLGSMKVSDTKPNGDYTYFYDTREYLSF